MKTTIAELSRFRPRLLRQAERMLRNSADAEDAVQETMLRAWKNIEGFRQESLLSTWLYSILRNTIINMLKARTRRPVVLFSELCGGDENDFLGSLSHEITPETILCAEEKRQQLISLYATLSDDMSETFRLAVEEGLSYAEIAQRLGVPIGTVRSRINRTRKHLGLLHEEPMPKNLGNCIMH